MAIAGRVAIVPKGEWVETTSYQKLDLVTHNRNAYIAKKPSTGVVPEDGEFWMLILENYLQTEVDELSTEISSILSGTTTVGNADTVDGKHADEFASADYAEETRNIADNISNPNLLINGDFRINQRGFTESTNTNGHYCVDRWFINSGYGTQRITSEGLVCDCSSASNACTVQQRLEGSFLGKALTFSVNFNGSIYTISGIVPASSGVFAVNTIGDFGEIFLYAWDTAGNISVSINTLVGHINTIKWAKLELGSVATPFVPRPYGEELALCQRYFEAIRANGAAMPMCVGTLDNEGFVSILIPTKTHMRINPTVSFYMVKLGFFYDGISYDISSILAQRYNGSYVQVVHSISNKSAGSVACYSSTDIGSSIFLDAEIY